MADSLDNSEVDYLTMEHISARRPKSLSARQDIARIWWNRKVHLRFHNSKLPVLILSQIKLVHALSYFLKIHFNIILTFKPRSSKVFPRVSPPKRCMHLPHPPICSTLTAPIFILDLITRIICGEKQTSRSSSLHFPVAKTKYTHWKIHTK